MKVFKTHFVLSQALIILSLLGVWTWTPFLAEAQVLGRVVSESEACSKPAEVFVGQGRVNLFQIHVPIGSNFEVKLNSGNYQFVAINEEGCIAERSVQLGAKDLEEGRTQAYSGAGPTHLRLQMQPSDLQARLPFANRAPASVMSTQGTYNCMAVGLCPPSSLAPPKQYSHVLRLPWTGPWWNTYGHLAYSNFSYPCAWGGWGCQSPLYPRGGPIALGKPNIYVEGPDTKNLHISLQENAYHHLMATSPAHMEKGWHFDLKEGRIVMQGGGEVPYLFYDSRGPIDSISNERGICGSKAAVIEEMTKGLVTLGFPARAVQDFREHWQARYPPMETCVYPVETQIMDKVAPVQANRPLEWTRILFVAIPLEGEGPAPQALKRFLKPPSQKWTPRPRQPASSESVDNSLQAFEWGIAFPIF